MRGSLGLKAVYLAVVSEIVDADEFASQARDYFGPRFGGVWIQESRAQRSLCVGIVNPEASDEDWIGEHSYDGSPAVPFAVSWSADELEGLVRSIVSASRGRGSFVAASIRKDRNIVNVLLCRKDEELIQSILKLQPSEAVEIEVVPGARAFATNVES